MIKSKYKIGVIGLGYVGLPLAIEFGKTFSTVGFDINKIRVNELNDGKDSTLEVENKELNLILNTKSLIVTHNENELKNCNIYIITVPTPIDEFNNPDLNPILNATNMVSKFLLKGDVVIYESTVYPGCTEEECVPILEKNSGLKYNHDFFCGYSPERINPGDKKHSLTNIVKVTSGSNAESAELINNLYKSIIKAGTFKASSIKVAEAAKVIENAQRDINIAFVNELSKIFNLLEIDTYEVLEAAKSKWNFLDFKPGLVGGHCIGVDPYYLAQKAVKVGYNPEIILSGRRLNDSMGKYVANRLLKEMIKRKMNLLNTKILILGLTFKENCPDTRNSRVPDIIDEIESCKIKYDIYDPWVNSNFESNDHKYKLTDNLNGLKYDAIILAVSHSIFYDLNFDELLNENGIIYDLKGMLKRENTLKL
jgi:UDP-N-acetyl-D-galactosamine dehydrogenase